MEFAEGVDVGDKGGSLDAQEGGEVVDGAEDGDASVILVWRVS